jgi:hypothetical protein
MTQGPEHTTPERNNNARRSFGNALAYSLGTGTAVGTAIGAALNNLMLGIAIGIALFGLEAYLSGRRNETISCR